MTVKSSWCVAARGAVAMIAADELQSLMETAHLLRSPKNAERLLAALASVRAGEVAPTAVDALDEAPIWLGKWLGKWVSLCVLVSLVLW